MRPAPCSVGVAAAGQTEAAAAKSHADKLVGRLIRILPGALCDVSGHRWQMSRDIVGI